MFDTKPLQVVIFLVLITIVYGADTGASSSTSATRIPKLRSIQKPQEQIDCENLMDGGWYERYAETGYNNFKTSYEFLSYKMIYKSFSPPMGIDETPTEMQTRLLKRELFTKYFLDLYSYKNGINFEIIHMESISKVCQNAVEQVAKTYGILKKKDNNIRLCRDAIERYFGIKEFTSKEEIFYQMYENWNIEEITGVPRKLDVEISYLVHLFRYYQALTWEQYVQNGFFKTIQEFCGSSGIDIVKNKHLLQENPFPL